MKLPFTFTLLPMAAIVLVTAGAKAAPPPLANAVILIIRHAEKPADGSGLAPAGQQRAVAYVHYFQGYQIGGTPLRFDHLIASADTKRSQRPSLTIGPISAALRLPIDERFRDKDADALAQELESRPEGKTILICWHHSEIPALLQALGAAPQTLLPHGNWPSSRYNWVIQLQYDQNGRLLPGQAKRVSEHLLPGDLD